MQLDAQLDRIHDEHPSVPEMMALRALSDSVKEFCARTFLWQAGVADVAVTTGGTQYTLAAPVGLQIVAPLEVRIDGTRIDATTGEAPRRSRTLPSPGVPRSFTQVTPAVIQLDRPASADAVMTVTAALTLRQGETAADIPDAIFDEYGEAIAAGAKMRLVRMAEQPWSAPALAPGYSVIYYTAVNEAKHRVMTSLGQADLQVEMRSW